MKKLLFLLPSFLLLALSCTNEEALIVTAATEEAQDHNNTITLDEAITLAEQKAEFLIPSHSRAEERHAIRSECQAIFSNSSRNCEDTLLHIINFANNNGFAIVSSVEVEDPVFILAPHGNYDTSDPEEVPGFNHYLENSKAYATRGGGISIYDTIKVNTGLARCVTVTDTLAQIIVNPRIGLEWDQNGPEGMYCSNGMSGCVPTAVALIMTYFKPTHRIYYTYENAQIPSEIINWELVCRHKRTVSSFCIYGCGTEGHNMIGRLCRQIGEIGDATYGYIYNQKSNTYIPTTGVFPTMNPYLLKYFMPNLIISGYNNYTAAGVARAVGNGLAYMRGSAASGGGHAWVAEGCKYLKFRHRTYKFPSDIIYTDPTKGELIEDKTTESCNIYYNFGWGGRYNCYVSSAIDGNNIYVSDSSGSETFTDIQYISIKR